MLSLEMLNLVSLKFHVHLAELPLSFLYLEYLLIEISPHFPYHNISRPSSETVTYMHRTSGFQTRGYTVRILLKISHGIQIEQLINDFQVC